MRSLKVLSGFVALLLVVSASVAMGGPLDRTAASKAQGDYEGHSHAVRGASRAYSYSPQAAPAVAAQPAQSEAAPQTAAKPENANRSFSLQTTPQAQGEQTIEYYAPSNTRRSLRQPRYLQADRKALGEY